MIGAWLLVVVLMVGWLFRDREVDVWIVTSRRGRRCHDQPRRFPQDSPVPPVPVPLVPPAPAKVPPARLTEAKLT